jgi:hypothetical protein
MEKWSMRTLSNPQKFDTNYRTGVGGDGNVYKEESPFITK